jgi:xanthine dehydrogenase accessory factor
MHEVTRIIDACRALMAADQRGLLVTVLSTTGSTYRHAGARLVLSAKGECFGAISGGCVEADLRERGDVWDAARVVSYDTTRPDDVVFGLGLGCRGTMEALIEPFDAAHPPRLVTDFRWHGREPVRWTTTLDGRELLTEWIRPEPSLVIFGSGGDVEPVVRVAEAVGWRAEVVRGREAVDFGLFDAAVIMTHNFLRDLELLAVALPSSVAYVGLLGPRSRGVELLTQLEVTPAQRAKLHSPVGLDLGAETPEEIALAIVAEVQSVLHPRRRPTAVVLAAGFSRRLGHDKQLVEIEGETLIRRAARIAREVCETVIVVTREPFADQVCDFNVVINEEAEEGIASSIRAGVNAATGPVLLMLCDQPHVTAAHLRALIATHAPLAATGYAGVAGVPALFGAQYREQLLALQGDRGAQSLLGGAVVVPLEVAAVDVD